MASVVERAFKQAFDDLLKKCIQHFYLERSKMNRHHYTCLAAPPELETFGLTHVVCREDSRDKFAAAFNSSAAASRMCDQLNGFVDQDDPSLMGKDPAEVELENANKIAEQSEQLTLQQKIDAAKVSAGS